MSHYAHSLPGKAKDSWQRLDEHLERVATLSEEFARDFAPGWGRLTGLWHDAGKYRLAFQDYICMDGEGHVRGKVDHSSVGALNARKSVAASAAFVVAGHHGGLPNREALFQRLREKESLLAESLRDGMPPDIQVCDAAPASWMKGALSFAMGTRFLFSALVDGDFLDTERFYAGGVERSLGRQPTLNELKLSFDVTSRERLPRLPTVK